MEETKDNEERKGTTDSQDTNYVSDCGAINPKRPSTFQKTQQVRDTYSKQKSISLHSKNKATQLQEAKQFNFPQYKLGQWIQKHYRINQSLLKDGGGARRIQLAKFSQVRKALFSCTMEAHAHQIVVKEIVLQEKSVPWLMQT